MGRAVVPARGKKARQLPGISVAVLELEFDCALIALDKEVFVGLVACSLAQETAFADVSFLSDNSPAEVHIPGSHSCVLQKGKIVPKCQHQTFEICVYMVFYQ